jgi:hypothetical protein
MGSYICAPAVAGWPLAGRSQGIRSTVKTELSLKGGIYSALRANEAIYELDSRSPAFAEDKLRGNDGGCLRAAA